MSCPEPRRIDVLGVRVSAVDLDAAVDRIGCWIREGRREYVCVTGVHGVIECQGSPELKAIHNGSGMTVPDGMPLVWSGRLAGASEIGRVAGADLMAAVQAEGKASGWRMFYYGSTPEVLERLTTGVQHSYPALELVGSLSPPFRDLDDDELATVVATINNVRPDVVWVGLSTPKQERWMARSRASLDASVLVGVGAAFDIHAGNIQRAPLWMQVSGLEWLFRLAREPRRLWGRYLRIVPRFLLGVLLRRPHLVVDDDFPVIQ